MEDHFSVAIDGPSGAGKSTIARAAAKRFGFLYVDTGAIYRTVGLAVERHGVSFGDEQTVEALLPEITVGLGYGENGEQRSYLNGEDVSGFIRTPEISNRASDVSAMPCGACLSPGYAALHGCQQQRHHGRERHRHRCAAGRRLENFPDCERRGTRHAPLQGAA